MLDSIMRQFLNPVLTSAARIVDHPWVTPNRLTLLGLALGLGAAMAAAAQWWFLALVVWWLSRVADALDGPLARRRAGAGRGQKKNQAGGFLDISADTIVYALTVIGIAVGVQADYQTSPWPFLVLLGAYYVNGVTLFAFSATAERAHRAVDDGRSLWLPPSFAGATESIVAHSLMLALPMFAAEVAWPWTLLVLGNAVRQVVTGYRHLS
jgi:phosphatidylglycerophosphate synthase